MNKKKLKKHLTDTVYIRNRRKNILKNTILLEAAKGQGIDGHILALLKADTINQLDKIYVAVVPEKREQVTTILALNKLTNATIIDYGSVDYFKKMARCEFLINDTTFAPIFSKRPEQKYNIIWHGTPQKYLGKDIKPTGFGNVQNNFFAADAVIVSNEHTKDVMINAFNLKDISDTSVLVAPSPRNSLLFTEATEVYGQYITTKKHYLYLPTWRDGGQETYLSYLTSIDQSLTADETFFVKLHPLAQAMAGIDFTKFEHIKAFPEADLYQFITLMDVIVTDYSSIFFDLFNTDKKIILFNYDKEKYFASRGVYENVKELGLKECQTVPELIDSMRTDGTADYAELAEMFTRQDNKEGSNQVLDYILNGQTASTIECYLPRNNKKNIVIFAGALWDNGISKSFFNFIDEYKVDDTNIILMIENRKVGAKHAHKLENLPEHVTYIERHGGPVATLYEKLFNKHYTTNKEPKPLDGLIVRYIKRVFKREFERVFSHLDLAQFIHFTGFDANSALLVIGGKEYDQGIKQTIFCHTDMVEEYEKKKNYKRKILLQTYKTVDDIAVVNHLIGESLVTKYPFLKGKVKTATNFLGDKLVRELATVSLWSDIRNKTVTVKTPLLDSIEKVVLEYGVADAHLGDILSKQQVNFPYLEQSLPLINEETSQVLPTGYEVEYQFNMLPYIYGYTKMKLLEDLANPEIKTYVYLGRYSPEKGVERILYAFEKLHEDNPNSRLVMISPHGMTKKIVLSYLQKAAMRESVYIFDGMENPYNLVRQCDALVLSSYYEGLGLVALEAIAAGTKVITTDLPELTRVLLAHGKLSDSILERTDIFFDESEYQNFVVNHDLIQGDFVDERSDSYPVFYEGDAMIVENSARGIYYGMSHFLLEEDQVYQPDFKFDELALISQKQYEDILRTN
ncbi:CDP-glycerol glycerophosphotransferase family protein [Vagococcus intermedius]|uniref:CDP-glycerol glycerophosphotransferase family protein n=1 Tax=Vagococcus intermedius TaxID=2991418 RepID=A0AAF0I835_9ENTE|nr:CDP-glycerol glycerophosphotransferase family protein [Vagococcus intermedius]WEG73531.1 CDP-glycerol glycerophosphotransferase family protein [Vagococcus intermedius]WEG75613.1 CDP-glycerol glycerophosphotransferase family protein [Vagococcus intermedius]